MLFRFRHFVTRLSVLRNPVLVLWRSSRVDVKLQAAIPVWVDAVKKKSSLADEQNFSAPLVGPMLGNVRDRIESQQNDHRPSYMSYRGLRRPRQLKRNLCEIFGAPQFSTFSTASVIFFFDSIGHFRKSAPASPTSDLPPTTDIKRQKRSLPISATTGLMHCNKSVSIRSPRPRGRAASAAR